MPKKKMDAGWVDKVKTTKVQEDYFDEAMDRGISLVLRVARSGSKTWQVIYRPKGETERKRFKIGEYPDMGLADARGRAYAILSDLKEGRDPSGDRKREKEAPTFKDLADEYIQRWAKPRKRSWKKDQDAIERDLLPVWEHRKAADIKKRDVIAVLDAVAERAPIQANRTLALVRKIYNWGISRDIVEANPCAQLQAPSAETQRDRVLSDDEIRAFWKACDHLRPLQAAAFRLRLVTAQRGGEVQTMRWSDLDLEGGWWTIPAERAKNKTEHRVPLSTPALSILADLQEAARGSEWVFPHRSRPSEPVNNINASAKSLREKVRDILAEHELPFVDFDLHDLRRTAASNMASLGVPRLVISRVLNHAEGGVTWIYDRYSYDAEKRQAMDAWAKRLQKILLQRV